MYRKISDPPIDAETEINTSKTESINKNVVSTQTSSISIGAPGPVSVPATAAVGVDFTISWGPASGTFDIYEIERKMGNGDFIYYRTTGRDQCYYRGYEPAAGTIQYRVRARYYNSQMKPSIYYGPYSTSGVCTVIANRPPTTPGFITLSQPIKSNEPFTITWGKSTDPDGNLRGYQLETYLYGGWIEKWREMTPDETSFTTNAYSSGTIQYRIRAVDDRGLYSGYATSAVYTIIDNQPPTISGQDYNFGALTSVFTPYSYTINDPDSPTLTVKETMDGAQRRTFTAAPGSTHVIQFTTDQWFALPNGSHTITITVTDQYNETATRNLFFSKNVVTADSMDLPVVGGKTYMLQLHADRIAQNPSAPVMLRYPSNMLQFVEFETSKPETADTTMPYPNGYYQLDGHGEGLVRLICTRAAVTNWSGHIATVCFRAKYSSTVKVELY